jgi:hypothetical protein
MSPNAGLFRRVGAPGRWRKPVPLASIAASAGLRAPICREDDHAGFRSARPDDLITEKFLGASPMTDDIVDVRTQSEAFLTALKQAKFFARTVVVAGAGHFFPGSDPLDQPDSFAGFAAPKVLRFLQGAL